MSEQDFVFNIVANNIDIPGIHNQYFCILCFSKSKIVNDILSNIELYKNNIKSNHKCIIMTGNIKDCVQIRNKSISEILNLTQKNNYGYVCSKCAGKPCLLYEIDNTSILHAFYCNLKLLDNI